MATTKSAHYAAQEKRDAIKLAEELGPNKAAKRLGIPRGTVSVWGYNDRKAKLAGGRWPPMPDPVRCHNRADLAVRRSALGRPGLVRPGPAKQAAPMDKLPHPIRLLTRNRGLQKPPRPEKRRFRASPQSSAAFGGGRPAFAGRR